MGTTFVRLIPQPKGAVSTMLRDSHLSGLPNIKAAAPYLLALLSAFVWSPLASATPSHSERAVTSSREGMDFSLHRLNTPAEGNTVLIVGGIQGDEPGGFHAASLLVTHYRFSHGQVWVVPNLNFESIVHRSRGIHGDMNRKFAKVAPDDPDFEDVRRIKALITHPEVDYILNLHDGSGFYRPKHIDRMHSPHRWGQSIIIDQEALNGTQYGALGRLATHISDRVNHGLLDEEHAYRVKNTRTREGDEEMAKTLTYFAINHGKPAVGVEASKNLPKPKRVYYHLNVIEAYLKALGIGFERQFDLSPDGVRVAMGEHLQLAMNDQRIHFNLERVRSRLRYVPLRERTDQRFQSSNPLVAVNKSGRVYRISYGNQRLTDLHPQYFPYDDSLSSLKLKVDGQSLDVPLGGVARVQDRFMVEPRAGYRVNVIGWTTKGVKNESGHWIRHSDVAKRFSVDKDGRYFRVEVYRGEAFVGMLLVHFPQQQADAEPTADKPAG